jgi:cellulose synthase/poly-beta-1,6-N-acetylglucosamine synthase-like glycosyltransferase
VIVSVQKGLWRRIPVLGVGSGHARATQSYVGVIMLVFGFGTVAYTYVGYPLLISLAARRRSRRRGGPSASTPLAGPLPEITVVVPALNEERVIADKLLDLHRQDLPSDQLEIIVVADGSEDRTAEIARSLGARVLHAREPAGKSDAISRGVEAARSQIVLFTDANCALSPGALSAVAACFADPVVAVAGGAKMVVGGGAHGTGEGLYWKIESTVMASEAVFGATMGVPGELYGVRRSLFRRIPPGVLNDDYYLTCDALRHGFGVGYAASARALETVSVGIADEMERRTRIAAGTWQTTLAHLMLCDPRRGIVAVAFVSHRVLRSIITPILLPILLATSAVLARRDRLARLLLCGQMCWYALGLLGFATDRRVVAVPFEFLLANTATLRGAARLLLRRQPVVWHRAQRGDWMEG